MTTRFQKRVRDAALLSELVDELGKLQAEKAELSRREKNLKARIIAKTPMNVATGNLFRANINLTIRKVIDWKGIAEKLGVSRQMIAGNTREVEVTTVRVVSRNAEAA